MQLRTIAPDQFRLMPWKNGKGSTTELIFENVTGQNDFAWRLSMAAVAEDGEFSDFSGYDRSLILLAGGGISLSHDNAQVDELSQRLDIASFDGGWSTVARLHDEQITDFNVMTRQGICTAEITIFREAAKHRLDVCADRLLIIGLDSQVDISFAGTRLLDLPAMHLLQAKSPNQGLWEIIGAAVICVQVRFNSL